MEWSGAEMIEEEEKEREEMARERESEVRCFSVGVGVSVVRLRRCVVCSSRPEGLDLLHRQQPDHHQRRNWGTILPPDAKRVKPDSKHNERATTTISSHGCA